MNLALKKPLHGGQFTIINYKLIASLVFHMLSHVVCVVARLMMGVDGRV